MKIHLIPAFIAVALVTAPLVSITTGSAHAQATQSLDPALNYGTVSVEAGKTQNLTVSVPLGQLGPFNEAALSTNKDGSVATGVVAIASVRSQARVNVEVRKATLMNSSESGRQLSVELRFALASSTEVGFKGQTPVEITLENKQNGNKTTFFVILQTK
jgi:hypothetical protein